ncbi:hypothetical protein A4S05_12995 [Nostoc sp. KVJ20]|nr:hypothetical protein A4S05_12995 [Nostoc sp. KVJ20]
MGIFILKLEKEFEELVRKYSADYNLNFVKTQIHIPAKKQEASGNWGMLRQKSQANVSFQ